MVTCSFRKYQVAVDGTCSCRWYQVAVDGNVQLQMVLDSL